MRRYETIVIADPDISDEQRDSLFEKFKELISQQEGLLILFDEWGIRKLAYEIKKKVRGNYVRLEYCGTGQLVTEMERSFQIDDRILKYMTVLLEKEVNIEEIKAKLAEAETAEKAAAAEEEPETPEPEEVAEAAEPKEAAEAAEPEEVAETSETEATGETEEAIQTERKEDEENKR